MPEREAFDRAFVAFSYLLDRRGDELLKPLSAPSQAAVHLARRLAAPERTARAQTLAAELGRVVAALDDRRLR
jgi:hypothetical protein